MKKEAFVGKAALTLAWGFIRKFPTVFHKGKYYGRNLTDDQISQLKWNRWYNSGGTGPRPTITAQSPFRTPGKIKTTLRSGYGYARPVRRIGTTAAVSSVPAYYVAGTSLSESAKGDDTPLARTSNEPTTTGRSPLSGTQSALVGGTLGGLGSLLYGTLADKPDLRRDLIATLFGGAAGGAYHLLTQELGFKKPLDQPEGVPVNKNGSVLDKDAAVPPWLGVAGRGALRVAGGPWTLAGGVAGSLGIKGYDVYQTQKENRRNNDLDRKLQQYYVDKQLAHNDAIRAQNERGVQAVEDEAAASANLTISQKAQRLGAGGALAGGVLGGLLSSAFGKVTDRESMRRDIISMLGGAAIGGTAGVLSGDPRLIPDWARSAADTVRSTADKVRSSVSDRLSPKV